MLTLSLLRHHEADLAAAFPGEDLRSTQVVLDVSEAIDATVFEVYPNDENGVPVSTVSRGSVVIDPTALATLLAAARVGLDGADEDSTGHTAADLDAALALVEAIEANLDLAVDETVDA